jgi:2-phosphosulfolactate phosphatase
MSRKSVAIDCLSESLKDYGKECTVVVVDVIRSITVAATIVKSGRRCFFAPSVEAALLLARRLDKPLLVGEVGGNMPYNFDLNNSPVEIERHKDVSRPAILVSSSGIPLLYSLRNCSSLYTACLRNYDVTINHLIKLNNSVKVLGSPTRGEFREEDKLCCAWVAAGLMKAGYTLEDDKTTELVNRWKDEPAKVCAEGNSAKYLRETGQARDLDFILTHVNDLNFALTVKNDEIVKTPA